jgi:CRP-like cAMP-binding protein
VSAKRSPTQRQALRRAQAAGVSNDLLVALPAEDLRRLRPSLEIVPLAVKQFLHRPGERIDYVFFPGGGFCSELTLLENGAMIEVATIGREGMVGLAAGSDSSVAHSVAMVQSAMDTSYRLPASDYRAEMDRGGAFHALLTRYMHAHVGMIMQSTACNAVHRVEQRLARWLLMAHDRIERSEFYLTQEFIAMMLGVARPTVTLVAGTLQKAGLITYHRGRMAILDRDRLEAASLTPRVDPTRPQADSASSSFCLWDALMWRCGRPSAAQVGH